MKMISNIVFTKNRPLQLEAYLESLYRYFSSELIQTYIIYKMELFDEQYQQLFQKYSDCIILKENDFHSDFLQTLGQVSTKYILFGVDDVVYFDSVDFEVIDESFNRFPDDIFGFSLRHSPQNAKACETVDKIFAGGQRVYKMNWQAIKEYPFELCATVYRTELVKSIINDAKNNNWLARKMFSPGSILVKMLGESKHRRKILKQFGYFYAPNNLESWSCRWCQNNASDFPAYLFYQKYCAAAIQVNIVNTSTVNKSEDIPEFSVEVLAEKYKQGYRLDIDFIAENKPTGALCENLKFRLMENQL